jgi:putative radical SAM enzyme (TIGR03279 family)
MVNIKSVITGSPADKAGIRPGKLISVNGHDINDVLDLQFYSTEKHCKVVTELDGRNYTYSIRKKNAYDELGFEFDTYLIDEERSCQNKCVFCFIDQNPPGMRESIYFKDDDSRLSFLQGNYITLTNLSDSDIDRIITMKMAVNISLHTMNPDLRCRMMNNRFAARGIEYLRRMVKSGVEINIQLVLCPGINDGKELEYTLEELLKLNTENAHPNAIASIAAVPVGLTKHREGLYPLEPFDKNSARAVINTIDKFQTRFLETTGSRRVFASDEFFLLAGLPIPDDEYYEEYPQYENGVGMLRYLMWEFTYTLELAVKADEKQGLSKTDREDVYSVIVTGESAYKTVCDLCKKAADVFPHIKAEVVSVKNNFFGGHVTVTGLLTGSDIISALKGRELRGQLILSADMFKKDTELFLDDLTISDVEKALNIKAVKLPRDGEALFTTIETGEDYWHLRELPQKPTR